MQVLTRAMLTDSVSMARFLFAAQDAAFLNSGDGCLCLYSERI